MDTIVQQVCLVLVIGVSFVHCEPALSNQYGVPGNFAGSNNRGTQGANGNGFGGHGFDNGNHLDQDYVDNQPKSYEFGYAVKDAATGNDFGRQETSDGETVRGEYRVQLPDGRTQIVSYTADWRTGFHAEVRYEGTAVFPEQYNTNGNNNNNNNNQGFSGNNVGQGYDFQGSGGGGYNGGNNGGYNNYRPSGGNNYNNNNNNNNGNSYPYQHGSNSLDSSYNFGARNTYNAGTPSPTYGPAFH